MLVLTRRANEKLSFPQVGITVHFIRVQGGHVKVGVDAPRDIAIVRDEIAGDQAAEALVRRQLSRLPLELRQAIRTQLHEIRAGTQLYRELVEAGMNAEAQETFATLQAALGRLEDHEVLRHPDRDRLPSVPCTVVLIDDEANERELLSGFLQLRGHRVVSFSQARAAINYLSTHDGPRFVLINVATFAGDAPALVREIRAHDGQQSAQIFAIGCASPQEHGLEIGADGVNRWFAQPLSPRLLIEALETEARDGVSGRDARRVDRSTLPTR